jgi:hypothetical protein
LLRPAFGAGERAEGPILARNPPVSFFFALIMGGAGHGVNIHYRVDE